MLRRHFCALALAPLVASCHGRLDRPAAAPTADDFHPSDPAKVGTTGRPQLLEFFGPT